MVAVQELSNPKGFYTVVMVCPAGKLIATLAGPFKGSMEANKAAKVEQERIEKVRQTITRRSDEKG